GQVWMAVTFFQVVFFYLVLAAGINPSSPVNPTPQSAWFWLYELANAGVYEEDHGGDEREIGDEQRRVLGEVQDERRGGGEVHDDGRIRLPGEADVVEAHADGGRRRVSDECDFQVVEARPHEAVICEEPWHRRPRRRS